MRLVFSFWIMFLFLFFSGIVSSYVSISPSGYDVNFQSGLEQEFKFRFDTGDDLLKFNTWVSGDLVDYADVSPKEFTGTSEVLLKLKLPKKIDLPGKHRIMVGIEQVSTYKQKRAIGAVTNVIGVVYVDVPYPGKYASMTFTSKNANAGDDVEFELKIESKGKETIDTISNIEIFDSNNNSIVKIPLGRNSIHAQEEKIIDKKWNSKGVGAGNYHAVASVDYGVTTITQTADFRLGKLFVDFSNNTKEFERNRINEIDIYAESFWNDPIKGVFVKGTVIPTGEEFLTPSLDLSPWQRGKFIGHFDTTGIEGDKFNIKLEVNYGGQVNEKIIEVGFVKEKLDYLFIGLITGGILIVIFILALTFWVIKLKRKINRNGKKKK